MSADSQHAARPTPKQPADPRKAFDEGLHQECADRVNNNCNKSFKSEHASMVALSGPQVKAGKCGCPAFRGEVATFSRLFKVPDPLYRALAKVCLPMNKNSAHNQISVVWETASNPDPHALLKAVALLFGRRVPLSTITNLTKCDKELFYERPQDH